MVQEPSSTTVHISDTPLTSPPPIKAPSAISTAGPGYPPPVEVSDTENHSPPKSRLPSKGRMSEAAVSDAAASTEDPPTNAAGSDGEGDDDDNKGSGKGGSGKSRRELPAGAVATLKAWLLSPEHFTHPYPTPQDQITLMKKTGIDKKQLKNWFTNARRRIWKPMLKKQLEQGKLAATPGGGGVAVPGVVPGLMAAPPPGGTPITASPAPPSGEAIAASPSDNMQAMHVHYQQAVQQQHQPPPPQHSQAQPSQPQQSYDAYGNPTYTQPQQPQQTQAPQHGQQQYSSTSYYQQPYGQQGSNIATSNSIGSLPPMGAAAVTATVGQMNKTDSHAVLMELFARDQDLVRQATEGARQKAALAGTANPSLPGGGTDQNPSSVGGVQMQQMGSQHPMKIVGSSSRLGSVPALNSWPHFSSVSSLNNLGTMTGVKSITNMSAVDLASQGDMNKKGNLAQVKSIEKMGRADSFAFLEVFFDNNGGSGMGQSSALRNTKREEDSDVGLSLDADDSPSNTLKPNDVSSNASAGGAPSPAPLTSDTKDKEGTNNNRNLKRAYDDALAARGLISVSRSSEKLTDLALPAKMQRTLSQEYIRQHNIQPNSISNSSQQQYGNYNFSQNLQQNASCQSQPGSSPYPQHSESQQYPGQHPQQKSTVPEFHSASTPLSDPSMSNASVEVPATTKCALCHCINVDTQLRPCGHMFHGRCLKPSLQSAMGPPKCPIDHIPMQSAVLAVPTDEKAPNAPQSSAPQTQKSWGSSGSLPSHQNSSTISAQNSAT